MIVTDNNILRKDCDIVSSVDEANNIIKLLEKELLYSALNNKPGVGLAAPQIGINKKVAIVRISSNSLKDIKINLINSSVKNKYKPFIFKDEGCLSSDKVLNTVRYEEVHVTNNLVEPYAFIATGFLSVVVQHELDHLCGILHEDRVVNKNLNLLKIKDNDQCLCGSMKKFKKCCGVK